MRKTVGYFTLLAAVVLVVCSAATLFWSAYAGASDPWQKWVQGTQIVCVIIWEAGALVAISYCALHRFPGRSVVVIGGSVLLLLAMGYTLNQENKQQAGAQESASTVRAAQNGKLELVRSELDKAIARRDDLQKLRKPTEGQQDELVIVRRDIAELKGKWEAQIEAPHAALAPGVALIARWTGLNMNDSADLDPLIKMAFWTMARVFALPLALFAISLMGSATVPAQASQVPRGMQIDPAVSSPLLARTVLSGLPVRTDYLRKPVAETPPKAPDDNPTPPADVKPVEEVFLDPPKNPPVAAKLQIVTEDWKRPEKTKPRTKAERLEAVDVITRRWLAAGTVIRAPFNLGVPIYADYCRWCEEYGVTAVNDSHFGRSLRRLKIASKKKTKGVHYGLKLVARNRYRHAIAA